jgi:DNA-binding transcriptional MerR regulator
MKRFFTPKEVCKAIGISYRQIQYWDKTRFIQPSYRRRGKYRLYTFPDLIIMHITRTLRAENVSIQSLRRIVRAIPDLMREVNVPVTDITFLVYDRQDILAFGGRVAARPEVRKRFIEIPVSQLEAEVNIKWPEGDGFAVSDASTADAA